MSLVPLSFGADGEPPLILVHDISGSPFAYIPFGSHPSLSQYTIYGLSALSESPSSTGFDYPSVHTWAESYADLVLSELADDLDADARVVLGGWSLGGVLAAEMARVFAERNKIRVVGLVLLDTYAPWHPRVRTGPSGSEGGSGVGIESAYFSPAEMTRIGDLLASTERAVWPGLDHTQCPAWLVTPSVAGANGFEEWFGDLKAGRVCRIGQGKEGCDHFSMMDAEAGWIEEVIAELSDALKEMLR
ncbi:Alpha/Beta hydrolase protein [Mycena sp. CBHHK59/15]|nr:Alpha/Beta hydrolase protein [Mycena sp. CBHHK59/15]